MLEVTSPWTTSIAVQIPPPARPGRQTERSNHKGILERCHMGKRTEWSRMIWLLNDSPKGVGQPWNRYGIPRMKEPVGHSRYHIVGWAVSPERGSIVSFKAHNSASPARDVKRAVDLRCVLVEVYKSEGDLTEQEMRESILKLTGSGQYDSLKGKYVGVPLKGGKLTYSVSGFKPSGKVRPSDRRRIYNRVFTATSSMTPVLDVERALKVGCSRINVSIEEEFSEDQKQEEEESKRSREREQNGK